MFLGSVKTWKSRYKALHVSTRLLPPQQLPTIKVVTCNLSLARKKRSDGSIEEVDYYNKRAVTPIVQMVSTDGLEEPS